MGREFVNVQSDLARNLRLSRLAAGVSQEELALRADVDRTYVSQIERGISNPSLKVVVKIAHCLAVDISDLIRPIDPT